MPDNIINKTLICASLILLFTNFTYAWAQQDNSKVRTKVVVYPYSGPKEGFRSDHFVMFLDTTTTNLMAELEDIFQRNMQNSIITEKAFYILPAKIVPLNPSQPKILLSQDDLNRMWSRNRRLLEILSGSITENPQRSGYMINSRIYSEAFAKLNRSKLVILVDDSSKQATKDFLNGHHMTILFTMAMDAKDRDQPPWLIARLLRKAYELSGQVDPAHSFTSRLLIEKIIEELRSIETASRGGSSP